jgi:hypothetical protein
LPSAERDDIVAELREELLSQIEERQAGLRRLLNTGEVVGLLKAYGHPFVVAAKYGSRQRLMGVELFPFYWLALRLVLCVVVLAHAFGAAIAMIVGRAPGDVLDGVTQSLWIVSMYMTGVVTFSFFAMDRLGVGRWIGSAWSPRFLPAVGPRIVASRLRWAYDWTFVVLLTVWATSAFYWPVLAARWSVDGNANALSVWSALAIQLTVAVAAQLGVHAISWVTPGGRLLGLSGQVVVKAGVLIALARFFRHQPWFGISNLPTELAARTLWSLNAAVSAGLILLAVLALIGLLLDARRLANAIAREHGSARTESKKET